MNINIKATNTTLTDAIRANIEDKLEALEKFIRPEDKIHVEVEEITRHKTGLTSRVEVSIQPHGYFAESHGNNFYEAMDLLIPKIKEQMTRTKDKKISSRRRLGDSLKRLLGR